MVFSKASQVSLERVLGAKVFDHGLARPREKVKKDREQVLVHLGVVAAQDGN